MRRFVSRSCDITVRHINCINISIITFNGECTSFGCVALADTLVVWCGYIEHLTFITNPVNGSTVIPCGVVVECGVGNSDIVSWNIHYSTSICCITSAGIKLISITVITHPIDCTTIMSQTILQGYIDQFGLITDDVHRTTIGFIII